MSSEAATEQTAALIRYTKVLARATIAYVVLTSGLLVVALLTLVAALAKEQ